MPGFSPEAFLESMPCDDPSHGHGLEADAERALCEEPKVLKLGYGLAPYSIHRSTAGMRDGYDERAMAKLRRPSPRPKVQTATAENKPVTSNTSKPSQLHLTELDAAARATPSSSSARVSIKTSKGFVFEDLLEAPGPFKFRDGASATARTTSSSSNTKVNRRVAMSGCFDPTENFHMTTRRPGARISAPPAALSARGPEFKALTEWDMVAIAEADEEQMALLKHSCEYDGSVSGEDGNGDEESGWGVV